MVDIAERPAAELAATGEDARGVGNAVRDAGITFLLALALLGSLVGLRTDSANGGLEVTVHFAKAAGMAAAVAAIRFLFDIVVWRPLDGGRTLAALTRLVRRLRTPAIVAALGTGLLLFARGGTRTAIIEWASRQSWAAGTATDLLTFACIAAFIVILAMAAVRAGRLSLALLHPNRISKFPEVLISRFGQEFPAALLIVAALLPFLIAGPPQRYAVDTATQILIYIMLGWGLNVVVGLAGLLDLGYVAFYAVGAYTYALISTHFGWSFWVCLPLAGFFAALWGMTLGFPVLRLRGDYLAIVTLAFGEIVRIVLINWQGITGGPNGVNRIPRPSFFGLPFERTGDAHLPRFLRHRVQCHAPAHLPLLRHPGAGAADEFRDAAAQAAAHRAGLGGAARRRDRLPVARHQHGDGKAHRVCHRRDVRRLRGRVLLRAAGLHQPGNPSPSRNPRSCSPSSCWAGSAASSAW